MSVPGARDNYDCSLSLGDSEAAMSLTNVNGDETKKRQEEEEEIARAESRCVFYFRIVTFGFLIVTTIAVALTIKRLMRNAEHAQLRETFHDNARKVLDAVGKIMRNTFTSVDEFGVSMTSFANAMQSQGNRTWPFVTFPDFAVRASKLRSLSKIFLFSVYHYIRHEDREQWEIYSAKNKGWIDEGIETQRTDTTFRGNLIEEWYSSDEINFLGQRAIDADFYLARWQASPVLTRWDAHSWNAYQEPLIHEAMNPVLDNKGVVISTSYNIDDTLVYGLQDFVGDVKRATQPAVEIYAPVLNYTDGKVSFDDRKKDANLVAIMGLSVFWQDLIEGILPIGNNGLVAVFDNAGCNQTFTYQINGPNAEYLGGGDRHDPDFDDLVASNTLSELTSFAKVDEVYSGPPLNEAFCPYSLHLYASKTMASDHITSDPVIFSFVAVAIFLFTSIVFLLYDTMIEKRQRKVMLSATRSSAIVSSLFPSTIRGRLYQEQESAPAVAEKETNQRKRMLNFMIRSQGSVEPINTGPIADLFDETTVMFADIKGFTKWSSSREPTQVFTLLETLYGAYDELAEKWGVYKIETIGDSYVAVCGLPEPRKDHAVAMTKFAIDMRRKTNELVLKLRETLGDGTEELQMRIGLHSGPTTGGVLRGQRARFQLFGDTVNVAARMESNGEGNKIQASEATADLLVAGGKGAWLQKRKDVITAKGKGEMQTFWVNPSSKEIRSCSDEHKHLQI